MTNKQQQQPQQPQPEEEIQDSKLLLKRFQIMEDFVNQVRKTNLDNSLDQKRMDSIIQWRDLQKRKRYLKFIQQTTNPKTGKWYTVPSLIEAGIVSEEEEKQFEDKTHPYRRLHQLYRVKTPDGKEFIQRFESWYGLTRAGSEIHISVDDLDYYTRPNVQYSYTPSDPSNSDSKQIRVGAIRGNDAGLEPTDGTKVYLTPFTTQKVHEFVKYANGPFTDPYHGTSLGFIKVGASNPISIKSLEEFLLSDFDTTWDHRHAPNPILKIDSKSLLSDIVSAQEQKQYQ